ncbi:DNA recombination protein RmuC [Silvibacterium dinghuense]|uniref:DNA recombination protein RmuC n=1 Tax=Silvibacterium dinghuense TaxID=1560006 RepID=A0A4V1NVX3_9BACT|nr:DNA recombination protein RmuC [Silvibacterium dinghuense]RXS97422.1 DNA recombination protein RmuC [Silvibacterium dinghuense]GGG98888.1 DNA recombination protein RmuC [Silvibacterium dinghuense]
MNVWAIVALAAGAAVGAVLAWVVAAGQGKAQAASERMRAEQAGHELAQQKAALEQSQREKAELTRQAQELDRQGREWERQAAERDAQQRTDNGRLETEGKSLRTRVLSLEQELEREEESFERMRSELQQENTGLKARLAEIVAAKDSEAKAAEEKLALLTSARAELSNQFEALANNILDAKSKKFTEQNAENLGNLLRPLKDKFGEFQTKVESLEKDGLQGRTELKSQIAQLQSLNERLSKDAQSLVTALRGSKTQGDWGEYVLESILEASGLRKGHEYRVQESFTREDHSRARLDVILDLPQGRHLVLDSKVSLNDYNDACNAADEAARDLSLAKHLVAVKAHIRELSGRNYQQLYGLNSLDFVIMFVPVEPAFLAAIGRDGKLWQEAWEKNVLLVSPSTLLFVLRTVAQLWRQEQQTRNVQEIVKRGAELYDKLAAFAKDLTDVGTHLDRARKSYEDAYGKLAQGKGNAIRQAEMLKALGVKPAKSLEQALPPKIAELALDEATLELAASGEEPPLEK